MRYTSNNIPICLYDSVRFDSGNDGTLYHFTTIESAKQILRNMTLKLSHPKGFNDPSDCNLDELSLNNYRDSRKLEAAWDRIRVLCFGTNTDFSDIVQYGFDHPRMWAQYADNNQGVCFAIDKTSLIKDNPCLSETDFVKVKYSYFSDKYSKEFDLTPDNICKFGELFIYKHKDWEHENETRLIRYDSLEFVTIKNSVAFIILGSKMPEDAYRDIVSILNDKNSAAYGQIGKDTLRKAYYTCGGVVLNSIDIASHAKIPNLSFEF